MEKKITKPVNMFTCSVGLGGTAQPTFLPSGRNSLSWTSAMSGVRLALVLPQLQLGTRRGERSRL